MAAGDKTKRRGSIGEARIHVPPWRERATAERVKQLHAATVAAIGCKLCGAGRHELCRRKRGGPRATPHRERIEAHIGRPLRRG